MKTLTHDTHTRNLENGTAATEHLFTYGAHEMVIISYDVPGITPVLNHVTSSSDTGVTLRFKSVNPWGEPDAYKIAPHTSGCEQDIDTLISDAAEAKQAMILFAAAATAHGVALSV